jgi:hypothetical protein
MECVGGVEVGGVEVAEEIFLSLREVESLYDYAMYGEP